MDKLKRFLENYFRILIPLFLIFILLRIFEYFSVDIKLSFATPLYSLLFQGIWFDLVTWLSYCALLIIPFLLISLLNEKIARTIQLIVNGLIILGYYGLLFVFSERLSPFDHELFVRAPSESISTVTEVATGRFFMMLPLFLYISLYYFLYRYFFRKAQMNQGLIYGLTLCSFLSFLTAGKILPSANSYDQIQEYYVVDNKLQYFSADSYSYLFKSKNLNTDDRDEVYREIKLFQQHQSFSFVNNEFPLLHKDEPKNVLKDFFNESDVPPNIVIIIYESLSSDFSGKNADIGSFTPFLDSLAEHSLCWYNFLSNADGTFGSLPSIIGSLPFGDRGFTQLANPVEHLSLVKILRKNNYHSYYFAGGEIIYDNFGGFMSMQGNDYTSFIFGPKYKKMGIGPEGWSAGYPDDALYNKSLEVLDSIHHQPYFSVYLTLSTHSPFIFDQMRQYQNLFEKRLKERNLPKSLEKRIRPFKPMLSSFLFSDDCMKNFFKGYSKRPDFKNTIFVIAGDHHHNFYPVRNAIDGYNVPCIIYSPLLKKACRFNSVNSHLNLAPTLFAYLKEASRLEYYPKYTSWLGDELDTCTSFRNIHHIPFMLTNRNIDDYLDGDYYISGDQLYELQPGLNLQRKNDKALLSRLQSERDNFRFINAYVCQNNKVYPSSMDIFLNKEKELYTFMDRGEKPVKEKKYYEIVSNYKPPKNIKKIKVRISFQAKFDTADFSMLPQLATSIHNWKNSTQYHWSGKEMNEYIRKPSGNNTWSTYTEEDIFNMSDYPDPQGHTFRIEMWNSFLLKMKLKDFTVKFFEIE